uniref:Putative phosphatidylinositol transfer protein sec14 n=1 Tax=Tabanus bromius TaxID=304241 RepID=A0A0K8TNI0_TABBR
MVNIRELSPALAKKARDELSENPKTMENDIDMLRSWIEKQPHLKSRTDDQFLVMFLRGCKYSVERAKQKIDMFYTVRTAIPEIFKGRSLNDPKQLEIIKSGILLHLPKPVAEDGPGICLIRPGFYDPNKYHMRDIIKATSLINEIAINESDNITVAGQIIILDLTNVSKSHLMQFDVMFIKKLTMIMQDGSPLRQKGTHYINTTHGFETLLNIFLSFVNEKTKKRILVHGKDMESLYKHVPKKLLPSEYGGEAGPIQDIIDYWENKVMSYRDYFLEEEEYGVNEKLRPGKPRNAEDLFGVDGTFRKLNID